MRAKTAPANLADFTTKRWEELTDAEKRAIEAVNAAPSTFETRMSMAELRLDPESKQLQGYAVVFNKMSEDLGWMREMIAPDAVDRTLRDGLDVRALIDHDPSKILGRTKAGTLRLKKDAYGLQATIDPPKTQAAKDIMESVRRGDVTGMSFAFCCLAEAWDLSQDPPMRTVTDMEMRDVSIVTYPAYPQTDIALRSLTDAKRATGVSSETLDRYLKLKGIK